MANRYGKTVLHPEAKKLKREYTYTNKICIYLTSNFGVLYRDKINFTTYTSTTSYITPSVLIL